MRNSRDFTFDAALQLKDAGAVTASGAAQVGGSAKILDMGAARFDGRAIVDITAIETDTGNELYTILIQGSNSATFASTNVNLGATLVGDSSVSLESVDSTIGSREIAISNEVNGTVYRYVRAYTIVAGTIVSGINYIAFLVRD